MIIKILKIYNKVKVNQKPNKYEESSTDKSRIKVTDTIDSDSTTTEININSFKKINKVRNKINNI